MKKLVALIVSIAVVDSLNPSTVGPAIYLATRRHAARATIVFTTGVFGVNVAAGLILTLGPGQLILAAIPHPEAHTKHLLELAGGVVALALVPVLWRVRHRVAHSVTADAKMSGGSTLALGAGIALAELPTAFPYFVVIAAIIGSESNLATQAALVLLFNVVLILPLLAIIAICVWPGSHSRRALEWLRLQLDRWAPLLVPLVLLILGVALVVLGAAGLITD